jgi:hypothetical protein
MTIYNEIDFLPYKLEWCRRNGLDIYVIDNYSTDSSYQWLKDHNIDCHQVDTRESFDLRILQREIVKTTNKIKPDWAIYNTPDLFIFAEKAISHLCMDAEEQGKNIIGFPMIDMCRIGEAKLFENYWYRPARDMIEFVYKWSPGIRYAADLVKIPNRQSYWPKGIMINYGRTKTPEQRKEYLKRRRLAWKRGLDKTSGRHYLREEAKGYKWTKDELNDIRESIYWKYLKNYV